MAQRPIPTGTTRKEVMDYGSVDHRNVPVERHCGAHVYHALDRSQVGEGLCCDLERKEDGTTWAFVNTRTDGTPTPAVLVMRNSGALRPGKTDLCHNSFHSGFADAVTIDTPETFIPLGYQGPVAPAP